MDDDYIDLYHRTTPENAAAIRAGGFGKGKERGEVYFSTERNGQADGYGSEIVHVRVPRSVANLDDEFPSGEQHYQVNYRDLKPEHVQFSGANSDVASQEYRAGDWILKPGAWVETDVGPGIITKITGRGIFIDLDDGAKINIVSGSYGADRLEPYEDSPAGTVRPANGSISMVDNAPAALRMTDAEVRQSEDDEIDRSTLRVLGSNQRREYENLIPEDQQKYLSLRRKGTSKHAEAIRKITRDNLNRSRAVSAPVVQNYSYGSMEDGDSYQREDGFMVIARYSNSMGRMEYEVVAPDGSRYSASSSASLSNVIERAKEPRPMVEGDETPADAPVLIKRLLNSDKGREGALRALTESEIDEVGNWAGSRMSVSHPLVRQVSQERARRRDVAQAAQRERDLSPFKMDGLTSMQRGRLEKHLDRQTRYNGQVMTNRELYVMPEWTKKRSSGGKHYLEADNGVLIEVPKMVVDSLELPEENR